MHFQQIISKKNTLCIWIYCKGNHTLSEVMKFNWGTRKIMGDNLKPVWAEFSTIS
jgi:hypothetical protein